MLDVTGGGTRLEGLADARSQLTEKITMSRMDQIEDGIVVEEIEEDPDIALWNRMGRAAMFFCLWSAMAIPVLLVIYARLA
jgi:hypothetical protein